MLREAQNIFVIFSDSVTAHESPLFLVTLELLEF